MEKGVKVAGIIAGSVIIVALIAASIVMQFVPSNTLSVNGQYRLEVVPDLVTVNFNIESSGATASEAKDKNSEIYNKLVSELSSIGIQEDEIKTSNFNIYMEYDWVNGRSVEKGYKANHFVTVELPTERSDNIGKIIDAGVDAGALISYINFELSESLHAEKKSEAIVKATEDARLKAEAMAQGLGKNIGGVVSVSDSSFDYAPWPLFDARSLGAGAEDAAVMAKGALESASTLTPEEQSIYGNVAIVYKIK